MKKKPFNNIAIDLGKSYGEMTQFVKPYKTGKRFINKY